MSVRVIRTCHALSLGVITAVTVFRAECDTDPFFVRLILSAVTWRFMTKIRERSSCSAPTSAPVRWLPLVSSFGSLRPGISADRRDYTSREGKQWQQRPVHKLANVTLNVCRSRLIQQLVTGADCSYGTRVRSASAWLHCPFDAVPPYLVPNI
jgi:hypothetical protein